LVEKTGERRTNGNDKFIDFLGSVTLQTDNSISLSEIGKIGFETSLIHSGRQK
jgi:hypothetical protein